MNTLFIVLFFSSAVVGLYALALVLLQVPSRRLRRMTLRLLRHTTKGVATQTMLVGMTSWVASWLPMDDNRRRQLSATLLAADIPVSPESYIAECLVKASLVGLLAIPFFFFLPIMGIVVIVLAILYYFSFSGKATIIVTQKREALELELPRFVSTLEQELRLDSNLQRIFNSYQKHAAPILKEQLELTLADMMSGNEETALSRWEARMNSAMLSEVVHGLQSVKHGVRGDMHFALLSRQFRQAEIDRLKMEATLRPQKMNIYSVMILAAFMATYFVVLLTGIFDSMQVFF